MGTILVLALALTELPDRSHSHVRSSEPRIVALVEHGMARSETFRRLVETLDASDVIVYVEVKRGNSALAGYVLHEMTTAGDRRYLRAVVDTHGAERRVMAILAHELQHVVEVAQASEIRDTESLVRLFARHSVTFGCAGGAGECYETQAAKDAEDAVRKELSMSDDRLPVGQQRHR